MRVRNAFYFLAVFLTVLCNNSDTLSKEIEVPSEPEQLRLFLLKEFTTAISVIDDVKIEYEKTQIPINPIPIPPAVREKRRITGSVEDQFTFVEEYIQKNGKERWVVLHFGKPDPTEDVSYRAELVRTENSSRFKVFDGKYILEYMSVKDGTTKVGRGILEASNTGFFKSTTGLSFYSPVKFFGYVPGLLPDDVLSSPQVDIETKPEIIDGLLAYKVSAPFEETYKEQDFTTEITYWLSPERSCLPVKIEVWLNGKFKSRLETKEFVELEDGRWVIKSILQRNFLDRQGEEGPRELNNSLYSIRKIELHPEIDEDVIFNTSPDSLPEGAHIIDKGSGKLLRYINYPVSSLIDKSLPELKEVGIKLSPVDVNDKKLLVCFFDYQQRPSRNCTLQLSEKAEDLKEKDIVIIAVQASKIEQSELNEWVKENNITFPVGMIEGDSEKTRFDWGVKSLPWLILTDKKHIVRSQGFGLDEMDEKIHFTKYGPGSLVYAVDQYVEEEQENIKNISSETFQDSLSNMCDWNSNYYKLTIQNYEPAPAIPSSLKLIIYSRRFAKLIEHGNSGFTDKEISGIIRQLGSDLTQWKKLYADGQSLRDKTLYFYKKDKSSEELILPLSYRINTSILLMGQFSIKEGLRVIIETAETFGEDTNWSAVGYACDKILTALNQDGLSSERRKIVNDYQTWRQSEKQKIFDYEVIELPSYKSSLRPFERATSLGANLDLSKGTINIEMPPQYRYMKRRGGAGYHDSSGNSEILKKVISFAKAYNEAKN